MRWLETHSIIPESQIYPHVDSSRADVAGGIYEEQAPIYRTHGFKGTEFCIELTSTSSFSASSSGSGGRRNLQLSSSLGHVPKCFGEISSLLLTRVPYPMLIFGSTDGIVNVYS
jgi:hypothetical protein